MATAGFQVASSFHKPMIEWDARGGKYKGVTIYRRLGDGKWYASRVPYDGVATQKDAALLLGVSLMTVNNWVRAGHLKCLKEPGHVSVVALREIKRVRTLLADGYRARSHDRRRK